METQGRLCNERPFARAALGFCAGILLYNAHLGTWALAALSLFLFCACILIRPARVPFLFTAMLLLGCLRTSLHLQFSMPGFLAPMDNVIQGLKQSLLAAADALFGENAPLIKGMLLGDRSSIAATDYLAFRDAGLAHILALSGLHISYFVGGIALLIPRRYRKLRFFITALFLLLYCTITGYPVSLQRASILWLCTFSANWSGRRRDLLSSLGFAALCILFVQPRALYDVGFQLSFGAVVGMALLLKPLTLLLSRLPAALAEAIATTLSATLGTIPIAAYHFGSLQVLSLFSNLLLLPFVPFLLIPALFAVLLYPLSLSAIPAFLAMHTATLLQSVSAFIAKLPFAVIAFTPNLAFCTLWFMGMLLLSPYILHPTRMRLQAFALILALMVFSIV